LYLILSALNGSLEKKSMPAKDKFAIKIIRTINLILYPVFIKELSNICKLGGEGQSLVRVSFEPFVQSTRGSTVCRGWQTPSILRGAYLLSFTGKKETTL